MSHDHKPSRVRVLDAGSQPPARRRDDRPPVVIDGRSAGTPRRRGPGILAALLFLAGTAIGGAGITWLGIARP